MGFQAFHRYTPPVQGSTLPPRTSKPFFRLSSRKLPCTGTDLVLTAAGHIGFENLRCMAGNKSFECLSGDVGLGADCGFIVPVTIYHIIVNRSRKNVNDLARRTLQGPVSMLFEHDNSTSPCFRKACTQLAGY